MVHMFSLYYSQKANKMSYHNDYQNTNSNFFKNSFLVCFLQVHLLQAICFVAKALK